MLSSSTQQPNSVGVSIYIYTYPLQGFPTVDGRNSAPVDMVDIPLFAGFHMFHTCQVVNAGFLPSTLLTVG